MALFFTFFFDPPTQMAVEALWSHIASTGLAHLTGHRPHVTLAAYESSDVATYQTLLRAFVQNRDPLPIKFLHLGVSPEQRSLYLAPKVSHELLHLHEDLLTYLHSPDRPPVKFDNLRPSQWLPHCTLLAGVQLVQLPMLLGICLEHFTPFSGIVEGISMVEILPDSVKDICDCRFAGSGPEPKLPHPRPPRPSHN